MTQIVPIGSYCRRCGEMTDGSECPFCGQMATPLDELAEARTFGGHAYKCDYWHDHYPHECTCGATTPLAVIAARSDKTRRGLAGTARARQAPENTTKSPKGKQ